MPEKRVTMKDIASEAGVSVATVSYVLNYSDKEKISHETRLKIFEAARRLNYVPNMNARTLACRKSSLVGIIINIGEDSRRSKICQYDNLIHEMQRELYRKGYDVVFLPTAEVEKDIDIGQKRSLDAVFIMDMDEKTMKAIAAHFFVPAIFVDGYVEDVLFRKLLTDYEAVFNRAEELLGQDYYIVMEDYSSPKVLEGAQRRASDQDIFVNRRGQDLADFLEGHKEKKGLVIGELLGLQAERFVDSRNLAVTVTSSHDSMLLPDTRIIVVSDRKKAEKAVEIMEQLLNLKNVKEEERTSWIKPE